MTRERARITVWAGLVIGSGVITIALAFSDAPNRDMSFSVVTDGVAGGLRAIDRVGRVATRVSQDEELRVGNKLSSLVEERLVVGSEADEVYVAEIVRALVQRGDLARPTMPYVIKVIATGEVNAYALPGGHLYITTAMLGFLENEAELAFILAHEMAHVDRKHCIERLQYELRAEAIGGDLLEAIVAQGSKPLEWGFSAGLEAEADRQGALYATRAGYHPQAGQVVFARLRDLYENKQASARSIAGEIKAMVTSGLKSYKERHPPAGERVQLLERAFAENDVDIAHRTYYVGRRNFVERTARWRVAYPEERVTGRIL